MKFLDRIVDFIFTILPKFVMIDPDEHGVFVLFGKWTREVGPGLYIAWDWCLRLDACVMTPGPVDWAAQSMRSKDGVSLAISGCINYSVKDARKALYAVRDYEDSLITVAVGEMAHYVSRHTAEDVFKVDDIVDEITKHVRSAARGWGLDIKRAWITDMVEHKAYRIFGDSDSTIIPEEE